MNTKTCIASFLIFLISFMNCSENNEIVSPTEENRNIEVIINDIPYPTEKYLRIGYTLEMWEFAKEGLTLQKIVVLNDETKEELLILEDIESLLIYSHPIQEVPFFEWDDIDHYYLSIQLPIPLAESPPAKVSHRMEFIDTNTNETVIFEGALFEPRLNESPVSISSPVKGNNWIFGSQSTMGYHFYTLFFANGGIWSGERYAFDNLQLDDGLTGYLNGDPQINESYYNYLDTLFAVSDGIVVRFQDNLPENDGDARNILFNSRTEYLGNYLVLDMGNGLYAGYVHCAPNSFFVGLNDIVREGDPIALLGNSGNSVAPHLHFQITDGPDIFYSNGIPFVIKKYTRINEFDQDLNLLNPPQTEFYDSMMEEYTIIGFE